MPSRCLINGSTFSLISTQSLTFALGRCTGQAAAGRVARMIVDNDDDDEKNTVVVTRRRTKKK